MENIDFEANTERTEGTYSKYNSIDDKTDPYHYWTTLIKFGIGRATYDASQEIRNHHIEREEAVMLVHRYDPRISSKVFPGILAYLDMDEDEFFEIADSFRSPHLWKRENGEMAASPCGEVIHRQLCIAQSDSTKHVCSLLEQQAYQLRSDFAVDDAMSPQPGGQFYFYPR